MTLQHLSIVPLEIVDKKLINQIVLRIEEIFKITVDQISWDSVSRIEKCNFKLGMKYKSTELINYFSRNTSKKKGGLLFITDSDLYSPVFDRYYGEAQLNGNVGIISSFHLNKTLSKEFQDPVILISRLTKEAIHEIGHLFGLIHCIDTNCVMCLSGKPSDIDYKSSSFCKDCSKVLENTTTTV